jgi:hypothetical protein
VNDRVASRRGARLRSARGAPSARRAAGRESAVSWRSARRVRPNGLTATLLALATLALGACAGSAQRSGGSLESAGSASATSAPMAGQASGKGGSAGGVRARGADGRGSRPGALEPRANDLSGAHRSGGQARRLRASRARAGGARAHARGASGAVQPGTNPREDGAHGAPANEVSVGGCLARHGVRLSGGRPVGGIESPVYQRALQLCTIDLRVTRAHG